MGSYIYTVAPIADLFLNSDHYAGGRIESANLFSIPCVSKDLEIQPNCLDIHERSNHNRLKKEVSNIEPNQI